MKFQFKPVIVKIKDTTSSPNEKSEFLSTSIQSLTRENVYLYEDSSWTWAYPNIKTFFPLIITVVVNRQDTNCKSTGES